MSRICPNFGVGDQSSRPAAVQILPSERVVNSMLLTRRVLFRDLPSSQLCHCLRTRILHTSQFNGTQHSKENDGRFKILFLGRDEFSCLVLRELHRARGQAHNIDSIID